MSFSYGYFTLLFFVIPFQQFHFVCMLMCCFTYILLCVKTFRYECLEFSSDLRNITSILIVPTFLQDTEGTHTISWLSKNRNDSSFCKQTEVIWLLKTKINTKPNLWDSHPQNSIHLLWILNRKKSLSVSQDA